MNNFIVVMECEDEDTPNYMTETGWCADIAEAELFEIDDALAAAEAATTDWYAETAWHLWIGIAGSDGVEHFQDYYPK